MVKKRHLLTVFVAGAAVLGGGVIGASAHTGQPVTTSSPSSLLSSVHSTALDLLDEIGLGERAVAPGTIDDGEGLLPQASITLEQAIAAAQGQYAGDLGEIDLEYVDGRLVFNVELGDHDVKVAADSGEVLGAGSD